MGPNGLPAATFAKLSPHEYLLANLSPIDPDVRPTRVNGRATAQGRSLHVNVSSLTHAHGSALVRTGDSTVICGVRGETLLVSDIPNYRADNAETELASYDLLVPNIELATGSAPQFLPGVPPTTLAQTLSTKVYSLLLGSKLVDPADLRIWHSRPGEAPDGGDDEDEGIGQAGGEDGSIDSGSRVVVAYWVLYIDIFFISYDGNPFDLAWAALLAALRDTKLPRGRWDPDQERVLCSRDEPAVPLSTSGLPIACSAAVLVGRDGSGQKRGLGKSFWVLVDPDRVEESVCDETVTAVVDRSGGETRVLMLEKLGGPTLSPEMLGEFVLVAEQRWEDFRAVIVRRPGDR